MSERYEIESVADFFTVPPERRAAMLVDLGLWLEHAEKFRAAIASTLPPEVLVVATRKFIWIDDGKHDAHVTVRVKETGEELASAVIPLAPPPP